MDALTKTKAAQATAAGTNAARTAGMYFTTRKISVPHLNVAFQENTDEVVYRGLLHAGHCRACIELVAAHRSSLSIDGGSFGGFGVFFGKGGSIYVDAIANRATCHDVISDHFRPTPRVC